MAYKNKEGKWACMFCNKTFTDPNMANAHRDTEHDFVLLPLTKIELANLMHFITFSNGNKELIPRELFERMNKFLRTRKNNIEMK
jgi:hypothetical protein